MRDHCYRCSVAHFCCLFLLPVSVARYCRCLLPLLPVTIACFHACFHCCLLPLKKNENPLRAISHYRYCLLPLLPVTIACYYCCPLPLLPVRCLLPLPVTVARFCCLFLLPIS